MKWFSTALRISVLFLCTAAFAAGGGRAHPLRARAARSAEQERRFDSRMWFEKREALTGEAKRLEAAYAKCVAALKSPAQNLTVPVENYADGSVKASVFAERAQFFIDEGLVWGEGVVISQYTPEGEVSAQIRADSCVVDRVSRSGWAEGRAEVVYGGTTVVGEGVYFSLLEEYVMILSGTKVTSTDLKMGGLKL